MIRVMRGLSTEEYAEVQRAVKALPFAATVRIHRQHYCYGAVDIRPTKKTNHRFSTAQVEMLRDMATTLRLDDSLATISQRDKWDASCAWQGVNYLYKTEGVA